MKVAHSVSEVLRDHVVLQNESIDRMYLNVYVPQLQRVGGVVWYLRGHLGQRFASTATVAPKTVAFVTAVERFAEVARPQLRVTNLRAAQRTQIVQRARAVLGEIERALLRKVEVHLGGRFAFGRQLEHDLDAVDHMRLRRLFDQ